MCLHLFNNFKNAMPRYKFNKIDGYESSYESDGETEYKIGKNVRLRAPGEESFIMKLRLSIIF